MCLQVLLKDIKDHEGHVSELKDRAAKLPVASTQQKVDDRAQRSKLIAMTTCLKFSLMHRLLNKIL